MILLLVLCLMRIIDKATSFGVSLGISSSPSFRIGEGGALNHRHQQKLRDNNYSYGSSRIKPFTLKEQSGRDTTDGNNDKEEKTEVDAEAIRQMNVDKLCQWLKPKVDDEDWNDVEQVIRKQRIKGTNFLDITKADWMAVELPLGVADSLVKIAQRISEAGAPALDDSLLSILNSSLLEKCETRPITKSNDGKLLAVCCSDFLIKKQMTKGFQQIFFLRPEAKREMDFCEEFRSNEYPQVALIQGSPGSGKSLTLFTWAWLKSVTANKTFVFITFLGYPQKYPLKFRFGYFQGGAFYHFSSIFEFSTPQDINELRSYILSLKLENAVLVLDGLTNASIDAYSKFEGYFQKMFFVTSQQVFLGETDKSTTRISFKCFPWKLEDYNQVCIYDIFWKNLGRDVFNPTSMKKDSAKDDKTDVERRTEMIYRKFYFAGYSARWMFREAESTLPQIVKAYASKVKDVTKYLFGDSWDKTDDAVNHILVEWEEDCYVLVSVYAATILARISKNSAEIADSIRISALAVKDARMIGLAYEVHIRNLLKDKQGSYVVVKDKESTLHQWTVNIVKYYNSLSWSDLALPEGRLSAGDWFLPRSFMQGGFDMFQVLAADNGYMVRFVQVTIAKTHSFKENYFINVLLALSKVVPKEFQLVKVEVVGLVPEYRLPLFSYNPVVPIKQVYPSQDIPQTVLHCTIFNDGNWLQNPIQSPESTIK